MELPCEIWEKIIVEVKDYKECIRLFRSFTRKIQNYIYNTFASHLELHRPKRKMRNKNGLKKII